MLFEVLSLKLELYFKLVLWSIFRLITPLHVGNIQVDYVIQWNRHDAGGITRYNKTICAFD